MVKDSGAPCRCATSWQHIDLWVREDPDARENQRVIPSVDVVAFQPMISGSLFEALYPNFPQSKAVMLREFLSYTDRMTRDESRDETCFALHCVIKRGIVVQWEDND
jgi:hypothetical protein